MKLAVVSHKEVWPSSTDGSHFATRGGFPAQMRALSEIFDHAQICVPVVGKPGDGSETPLVADNLEVLTLRNVPGKGSWRKASYPIWFLATLPRLARVALRADAIHAPIPGDVGTAGIIVAEVLRKPLFVRYCGDWTCPKTRAERLWRWYMEKRAGGRRVMLVTGEGATPPSANSSLRWIFSTTLTEEDLAFGRPRVKLGSPIRLVIVSRQVRPKGTEVALRTVRLLRDRGLEATLDVAGDGPDLSRFRALADELSIASQVAFHGELDHLGVLQLLARSDLMIFPTTSSEGFPKVIGEAFACGLPVLSTKVSTLEGLVSSAGVTLGNVDARSFADAVEELRDRPDLYASMSRDAIEKARRLTIGHWRDEVGQALERAWGHLRADEAML